MATYMVGGTLTDSRTVTLDEPLPAAGGRVRATVELLPAAGTVQSLTEFLTWLREQQRVRGHVPRSREDIDAQVRAERESW